MSLAKILSAVACLAVASCYLFPFVLAAFPIANSKMILAAIGLAVLGFNMAKGRGGNVSRNFLSVSVWALVVSGIAFLAVAVNNTHDYTYCSYIVSMWVWLGGAYALVSLIKAVHGHADVRLVCNYLIGVCAMQCVLALYFNASPSAEAWYSSAFAGESFMGANDIDRLHGIGCALDVAGLRFSAVLIGAAYLIVRANRAMEGRAVTLYLVTFFFITLIGNMISRTTTVGASIGVAYMAIMSFVSANGRRMLAKAGGVVIAAVAISVYLYNADESFHDNIRFGFEGFFSYFEKGEWQTNSNDILAKMVVFPDNARTWLIGDGYINNPLDSSLATFDPYYVGPNFGGYYMQTDIGYLRFLFYFGLIGLVAFISYFIDVCRVCMRLHPAYSLMFVMMLAVNFIGWFKVATDIFVVFAPYLCLPADSDRDDAAALRP